MKHSLIGLTGFAGAGKDTVADLLVTHLGFRKLAFADALRAEVAQGFGIETIYLARPETKGLPIRALSMRRAPSAFLGAVVVSTLRQGQPETPMSDEWLDEPRSPRQILQWWGTEYRRTMNPRYWTRLLIDRVTQLGREGACRCVVTDVRFPNEADVIHGAGGLLWQITRPGLNAGTTSEGNHASATDGALFKPAAVIANSHDIRHLQHLVLSEFVALESGIKGAKVVLPA